MKKINLIRQGAVAICTINRPDVKNALDLEAYYEFEKIIKEVRHDTNIRVVVINGEGSSFCTGLDLKFAAQIEQLSIIELENLIKRLQDIFAFEKIAKPVISAVQGYAMGNGCDIALASDFIIAAESAKMTMAYTNLGLIPDLGGTFRLPRLVGLARARELILTGREINAQRALEIGMVAKVVPDDKLMEKTMEFADRLSKRPPIALALAKEAINKSLSSDLSSVCTLEASMQSICLQSSDVKEAIAAFAEKRDPEFKGR